MKHGLNGKRVVGGLLVLACLCGAVQAIGAGPSLVFQLRAYDVGGVVELLPNAQGKIELSVGEQAVLGLWGKADPDVPDPCGINVWQLDMTATHVPAVGGLDVIGVAAGGIAIFEPIPHDPPGGWTVTGADITTLGALANVVDQPSSTGVEGNFSRLANVTIDALAEGEATYSLGGSLPFTFGGFLRDGATWLEGSFDEPGSNNEFVVVPEPSSLALLVGAALAGLRRRRKSAGRG